MAIKEVGNKYYVDWTDNIINLGPVIAFTIKQFSSEVKDIDSKAFVLTHQSWVDAGFSGCSVPMHIILDHTNENVANAPIENLSKLKSFVLEEERSLPEYTHCGVSLRGSMKRLCGVQKGEISDSIGRVTCPCCIAEVFSKTEFNDELQH